MPDDEPPQGPASFYLIVIDHDRGMFTVEGPMTDDRDWRAAVRRAWSQRHRRRRVRPKRLGPRCARPPNTNVHTTWPACRRAAS